MKHVFKDDDYLHIHSMSKALRVTAIFTDVGEANAYMANHRDEGVIAVKGPFVFLANLYDKGI